MAEDGDAALICAVCLEPCDEEMRVSLCKDWLCMNCARRLSACPVCGKQFYIKHRRLSVWEENADATSCSSVLYKDV